MMLLTNYYMKSTEYIADRVAVKSQLDIEYLAKGIKTIEELNSENKFSIDLNTHPKLERRIKRLKNSIC